MSRTSLCLALLLSTAGCPRESTDTDATGTDTDTTDTGTDTTTDTGTTTGTVTGQGITVVTCADAPTADPGDDVCAVVAGDERMLLVGDVLQHDRVFEQGAVLVEDGLITCVGCDCVREAAGATEVVCPDAVISPSLVNAHDHIGWMNGEPWVAAAAGVDPDLRWEHRHDWRLGERSQPEIAESGGSASRDQRILGEIRMALSGVTALFGSGDMGGLIRDLDGTGSGRAGLASPPADYDTFPLGDSRGAQSTNSCSVYNISGPAASVEAWAPHVAEGIDEEARNELRCLTGTGPSSQDLLRRHDAIIHGIAVQAEEAQLLADRGIQVIWTPRSNVALYGETAPVTLLDTVGVGIGLGTDWLPSGSMNMLRELSCAASLNDTHFGGYFRDADLFKMATLGSARALGFDDEIGYLAPGYVADIAVFANAGEQHHAAVVRSSVEHVALVLKGGRPLTGNASVVAALTAEACDTLPVCGVDKQVCLGETGRALAELPTPLYGLFYCDTPLNEPSCVPARVLASDQVNGSSLYDGVVGLSDADGDGIVDVDDLCPDTFDPIRPVDDGAQADADGDGLGDVCDVCPLDADVSDCVPADPDDLDQDGIPSWSDNCPRADNADQADADADGKGDACDACPDQPNPGPNACSTTIFALQDESDPAHPPVGSAVAVDCVITAAGPRLSWCQDPLGGPFSGISIFVGTQATYGDGSNVQIGDRVQLSGIYEEYYGASQLSDPAFRLVANGTPLEPVVVDAASIATDGLDAEAYEGVLVRVENVSVVDVNPDAPGDFDEFAVTGNLRIDDLAIDASGTGGLLDNTFALDTAFTSITGVHHFSFSDHKLLPRSATDLVLAE